MSFPHTTGTLISTWGYHPAPQDAPQLVRLAQVGRFLVLGSEVPDVVDLVGVMSYLGSPDVALPRGLYWFAGVAGVDVMLVQDGAPPGPSLVVRPEEAVDGHPLGSARVWMMSLWDAAAEVPVPEFAVGDEVLYSTGNEHTVVRTRRFSSGTWLYEVRLGGRLKLVTQRQLGHPPMADDPSEWLREGPGDVERFAATLTRAKLEGSLSDTMFSFRATRTLFRPYQFKPVMKLLQTGKSRLLIADEVGLGKTIEAGLIWTELEARKAADRVLIVCPSALVAKWRHEMDERFNFELVELDGATLSEFEERAFNGRLPQRGFYVGSLERLRRWEGLGNLVRLRVQFDLVIVDEAHYMRNVGTRSNALGAVLSELTDNLVFLSATPLNLRSADLYNLIDLLSPGEFGDEWTFDERLAPNAVLHKLGEGLHDTSITGRDRLALLDELANLTFGGPLLMRPEVELLRRELETDILDPASIVRIRRLLADLNAMSATVTRTRKVEVEEDKAVRRAQVVSIDWSERESAFYEQYLAWCHARADAAGAAIGFAMQMPLRLASACLPAARDQVLNWATAAACDEDDPSVPPSKASAVPPHSALLTAARELGEVDSKFDRLLEQVKSLVAEGKRTLLFTFSRPALDYLRAKLQPHARVAVLHGGVNRDMRHRIIADFRSGDYDIVLANRVASEGLDFEFCSVVINYDLPWNPMEIEQRIGRIDRMGQQEETIVVVNFHNPATIDDRILSRVLDRIGIFERSIGALEPIILSNLTQLQAAMFDFSLTEAEREHKANQVLEAIEGEAAGVEDLARAASYLLVSDDVDVRGMETDLLRSGRYVGRVELQRLVDDWCLASGGNAARVAPDGRSMTIRGNSTMAQQLQTLVTSGRRTTLEVESFIAELRGEMDLHVVLDQELARTTGGSLLTANHPLVLAALAVPGFQQVRFARVRVSGAGEAPEGVHFVQLGIAEWGGLRPGRAIWGAAVNTASEESPPSVVERLLSALATGDLRESALPIDPDARELVDLSSQLLTRRQVTEEHERALETQALLEARRVGVELQHQRKLDAIRTRRTTAQERGVSRVIPLFDAQMDAARARYEKLMADLENSSVTSLSLTPLAICQVEVLNG